MLINRHVIFILFFIKFYSYSFNFYFSLFGSRVYSLYRSLVRGGVIFNIHNNEIWLAFTSGCWVNFFLQRSSTAIIRTFVDVGVELSIAVETNLTGSRNHTSVSTEYDYTSRSGDSISFNSVTTSMPDDWVIPRIVSLEICLLNLTREVDYLKNDSSLAELNKRVELFITNSRNSHLKTAEKFSITEKKLSGLELSISAQLGSFLATNTIFTNSTNELLARELSSINLAVDLMKREFLKLQKLVRGDGLRKHGTRLVGTGMLVGSGSAKLIASGDDCFDLCRRNLDCVAATFSSSWLINCYLFKRGDYSKQVGSSIVWESFVKDLFSAHDY